VDGVSGLVGVTDRWSCLQPVALARRVKPLNLIGNIRAVTLHRS